ncbi:MAG: helix-turn-helix domain-containing protein [Candidatus Nitrosopolaris sp.]
MLPQALKLKVIQQASEGKLQKDIAQNLGISTGSVCNILKASREDKQKHEDNSNSSPQEQPKQPIAFEDPSVAAKDYSDLQIISQPQSQEIQNIQQQQPLVSSQEPHLESSRGCPLSRFILQEYIQPQIPEVNNLDIEHPKIPKEDRFSPNYNPVNKSTTITSPGKTSQPSADIEDIDFDSDPDYDPDIYTDPDVEYDPTYDGDPSNSLEEGWDSEPERLERRIQTTVRPTRQLESFRTQNYWIVFGPIFTPNLPIVPSQPS